MEIEEIYQKAIKLENLTFSEAKQLYTNAPLSELTFIANQLRKKHKKNSNNVGWIIDRNVNITNVCFAQCKFCNFCRTINSKDAYITTIDEYKQKIEETLNVGGNQLLLQGGMHPNLGLEFYTKLFKELKSNYPNLKLHALSPTEIVYLSKQSNLTYKEVLELLIEAGLDSLPGAGAEILSDRVRKIVSPAKCTSQQWLDVMAEAHKLNLPTSATMMFGFIETIEERIEHLFKIRNLQAQKPANHFGFITFVPWPFQAYETKLSKMFPFIHKITPNEYIRLIAMSRIILNNIENIQTSWLTVGQKIAEFTLWAGANDMGSIMIEENVVSAAGAKFKLNDKEIQNAIIEAGFEPKIRNQKYEIIED